MINAHKQQMFLDNEKLIYFVLKKYFPYIYNNIDDKEEYYQVGSIGLLKAIDNYNSSLCKFSTYAIPMIWGEIKRNLRDNKPIHFSHKIKDLVNNIYKQYNELEYKDEFKNYVEKVIQTLNITNDEKIGIMNYIFGINSINHIVNEDNDTFIEDTLISPINIENDIIFNDYIFNISNNLIDRDKLIFKELLVGETQNNIGLKHGISQAQISRIEKNIKLLAVNELINSNYNIDLNKFFKNITNDELLKLCKNIYNKKTKLSINNMNKELSNMHKLDTTIYSKKRCNKLILKCTIKLMLKSFNFTSNEVFKTEISKMLLDNNYNNQSILDHLNNLNKSQINSCISLAKKTIEKYNYKWEHEVVIDEIDFKSSKLPQKEINDTSNVLNLNIIVSVIDILNNFRKDNLSLRF